MSRMGLYLFFTVTLCCFISVEPAWRFLSQPQEITVLQDEQIQIVCSIEDVKPSLPMLWMNNSNGMGMNDELYMDDVTYAELTGVTSGNVRTYTLTIYEAGLTDEGEYECQVPGPYPLKQIHTVTVNIPPEIIRDPAEDEVLAKEGETITLNCLADGKPTPTVTWTREGASLPDGSTTFIGERLTLEEVEREDTGEYQCVAANGAGSPVSEMFFLDVHYPPSVSVTEKIIHTGPGNEVQIECEFDSNPDVEISWLRDGAEVMVEEEANIAVSHKRTEDDMMLSSLTITNLEEDDIGKYTCLGKNGLGQAEETVSLSALPQSIEFLSPSEGEYSDVFTLEWTVESVPKPVEFYLTLFVINETGKVEIGNNTVPAVVQNSRHHPQRYDIRGLESNTTYIVHLIARNTFGSNSDIADFTFSTSEDENVAPEVLPTPKEEEEVIIEEPEKDDEVEKTEDENIPKPEVQEKEVVDNGPKTGESTGNSGMPVRLSLTSGILTFVFMLLCLHN